MPSLDTSLLIVISEYLANFESKELVELSKFNSTSALLISGLEEDPEKITSSIESPLRFLAEDSPITHLIASIIFDLPQPFGPIIPVRLLGNDSVVGSTNVLNPANLILVSRIEKPLIDYNIILGIILLSGDNKMKAQKIILDTFPNPNIKGDYLITMEIPEFTCLCPLTGQPDFAEFEIKYIPDRKCIELKSLKLYMSSYRDVGAFHEDNTNQILHDLTTLIKPRYMSVIGYWKVRGGIITTITTKYIKKGWENKNLLLD